MAAKKTSKGRGDRVNKYEKLPANTLEEIYRKVFVERLQAIPARERLSMYKSVPTVTTYGAYDKPA